MGHRTKSRARPAPPDRSFPRQERPFAPAPGRISRSAEPAAPVAPGAAVRPPDGHSRVTVQDDRPVTPPGPANDPAAGRPTWVLRKPEGDQAPPPANRPLIRYANSPLPAGSAIVQRGRRKPKKQTNAQREEQQRVQQERFDQLVEEMYRSELSYRFFEHILEQVPGLPEAFKNFVIERHVEPTRVRFRLRLEEIEKHYSHLRLVVSPEKKKSWEEEASQLALSTVQAEAFEFNTREQEAQKHAAELVEEEREKERRGRHKEKQERLPVRILGPEEQLFLTTLQKNDPEGYFSEALARQALKLEIPLEFLGRLAGSHLSEAACRLLLATHGSVPTGVLEVLDGAFDDEHEERYPSIPLPALLSLACVERLSQDHLALADLILEEDPDFPPSLIGQVPPALVAEILEIPERVTGARIRTLLKAKVRSLNEQELFLCLFEVGCTVDEIHLIDRAVASDKERERLKGIEIFRMTSFLRSGAVRSGEATREELLEARQRPYVYDFELVGSQRRGKGYTRETESEHRIPLVEVSREGTARRVGMVDFGSRTFYRQTRGEIDIIKVKLPEKTKRESAQWGALLAEGIEVEGRRYRLDLFNNDDEDAAWGIAEDQPEYSEKVHPYAEAVAYSRQALLTEPLRGKGYEGDIAGAALPIGTKFPLKGAKPSEDNGLLVGDGWGFIRESLAEKANVRRNEKPGGGRLESPALPNTQMLQWLPEADDLVLELVESGLRNIEQTKASKPSKKPTEEQTKSLYRSATTGQFLVRIATAMPVQGEEVVPGADILAGGSDVALHRSPADKPNWVTGRTASPESGLSRFLAQMLAIQYRWTGSLGTTKESPLVFFKGMLGVIPDEQWPDAFGDVSIVLSAGDRKIDTRWSEEGGVKKSKTEEDKFLVQNSNLAITKIVEPGGLIGVPQSLMEKLSGDYDGDEVHLLDSRDSPVLFDMIRKLKTWENKKLDKRFTFEPGQGLADRLLEVAEADSIVGIWSTIADLLLTVHPLRLEDGKGGEPGIASQVGAVLGIDKLTPEQMWHYVSLGIKVGTDLVKTNLKDLRIYGRPVTARGLIEQGGKLLKLLRDRKGLNLKNPHAKRNEETIAQEIWQGKPIRGAESLRKGHYGNLGRILRGINQGLKSAPEIDPESPESRIALGEEVHAKLAAFLQKAREAEIESDADLIRSLYALLGGTVRIIRTDKSNPERNRDSDLWMVRVVRTIEPGKIRQRLADLQDFNRPDPKTPAPPREARERAEELHRNSLGQIFRTQIELLTEVWEDSFLVGQKAPRSSLSDLPGSGSSLLEESSAQELGKPDSLGSLLKKKARVDRASVIERLGDLRAKFVEITGVGMACYVRSIVTALVRNGALKGSIETWVETFTDHLKSIDLRMEGEMIDAGGLDAAEVRRAISELTRTESLPQGVDVGIRIVQWDPEQEQIVSFDANQGIYQITLLYTPGHFDLLA